MTLEHKATERLTKEMARCKNRAIPYSRAVELVGRTQVEDLLYADKLRQGINGVYLPEPPDPGAVRVFKNALLGKYDEQE